jgi:VanZ family protein
MKNRTKRIILWGLVFIWMSLIFSFSADGKQESAQKSQSLTTRIVKVFYKDYDLLEENKKSDLLGNAEHIIRKTAHAGLYFILGALCFLAMLTYEKSASFQVGISALISGLYSASDEIHQAFVPNRGPMISDVFIDISGAFFGIACVFLITIIVRRIKRIKII